MVSVKWKGNLPFGAVNRSGSLFFEKKRHPGKPIIASYVAGSSGGGVPLLLSILPSEQG